MNKKVDVWRVFITLYYCVLPKRKKNKGANPQASAVKGRTTVSVQIYLTATG